MAYYVAGVAALNEKWFHGYRHANPPFEINDDLTLHGLAKEAKEAGLAEGDVMQTLEGRPFTGDAQITQYLRRARPGDVMHVNAVSVRLTPLEGPHFTLGGYIAYLMPILGVSLLGLLVGYWVVAARPTDPNAWLVLVLLTFPEASFGDLHAVWWAGVWYIIFAAWQVVVEFLALLALLWFGLFFPERSRLDRRFPWIKWIFLGTQLSALVFYLWFYYLHGFAATTAPRFPRMKSGMDWIAGWGQVACVMVFLIAIFDKLRSASTPDARRRLRVLAVGSALSLGPLLILFGILPHFGYSVHRGKLFEVAVPLLALFPVTLAYVLVVQRAMDIGVLLRMGTKYLLAKATLMVTEIAVAGFLLWRFAANPIPVAIIVALLLAAFVMRDSLSSRLRSWLDRKFFREAYNAELVLSELSEHTRNFAEKGPLIEAVSRRISEVLHVPRVAVWLRASNVFQLQQAVGFPIAAPVLLAENSSTVRNLVQTNRPATVYRDRPEEWLTRAGSQEMSALDQVEAELLLALPGRDRLMGVMALGPKRSEAPYSPLTYACCNRSQPKPAWRWKCTSWRSRLRSRRHSAHAAIASWKSPIRYRSDCFHNAFRKFQEWIWPARAARRRV